MLIRCLVCILFASLAAYSQVQVEEPLSRAELEDGHSVVSLAFNNTTAQALDTRLLLEWLGPNDDRFGPVEQRSLIAAGKSHVAVPLPIPAGVEAPFLRLHYRVTSGLRNLTAFPPIEGWIALARLTPQVFVLQEAGPASWVKQGRQRATRILATHFLTDQPIAGVTLNTGTAQTTTDASGIGTLLTEYKANDIGNIEVTGVLGDLQSSLSVGILSVPVPQLRLMTDKPLYQPGQTVHMRLLVLGPNGRAQANAGYQLQITNEQGEQLHTVDLQTSRFGVAHSDWNIPEALPGGQFRIEVQARGSRLSTTRTVTVAKYELPTFQVKTKSDRSYYLPGQNAIITIEPHYFFGRPLKGAKVQVRHDEDEGEQEAVPEGPSYRIALDLSGVHQSLADSPKRFRDITYTVLVTDRTSGRTEQQRFAIRVSRDPVHLYLREEVRNGPEVRLYVTAFTPDGLPARTMVELVGAAGVLATANTNRFGLARFLVPAEEARPYLRVRNAGRVIKEVIYWRAGFSGLSLSTERSLYRRGEPIRCRLVSDRASLPVVLVAQAGGQDILHERVTLKGGRAEVTIPAPAGSARRVDIFATSGGKAGYEANHIVLYPGTPEFRISAQPRKGIYRPGEMATIALEAGGATGGAESALGISLVDESLLSLTGKDRGNSPDGQEEAQWPSRRLAGYGIGDLLALSPEQIDADWQLLAEDLLIVDTNGWRSGQNIEDALGQTFHKAVALPLRGVERLLNERYGATLDYPRDEASLYSQAGALLLGVHDPWGKPYQPRFRVERNQHVLELVSAGPDEAFHTADDLIGLVVERPWFHVYDSLIRKALAGQLDLPATEQAFRQVIEQAGLLWERLHDPWNHAFRMSISHQGPTRLMEILSAGPDGQGETQDDVKVTEYRGTYFGVDQARLAAALARSAAFPRTPEQWEAVTSAGGVMFRSLLDLWGHPYRTEFDAVRQFKTRVHVYTLAEYEGRREARQFLQPVNQTTLVIRVWSDGPDGLPNTQDDFVITEFARPAEAFGTPDPQLLRASPVVTGQGRGALAGVVLDVTGAVIPRALVQVDRLVPTHTDETGSYRVATLPAGLHRVTVTQEGFQILVIDQVPIEDGKVTGLDAQLEIGTVSKVVDVQADAATLQVSTAESAAWIRPTEETATPRLRTFFPETLLWMPELITDAAGHASVKVKLADSITTWKLHVIASTEDGRVSETTAEVRAFQPFFVDLTPPPVLTVGDDITFAVPVRNYLTTAQKVGLDTVSPTALHLVSPPKQTAHVPASSSFRSLVRVRASAVQREAKLRVVARAKSAGDAIEKPLSIHPYGEPVNQAVNGLLTGERSLAMDVPATALAGSLQGELKIYPTLAAHVLESAEALLSMPRGCAEQTISSAYPSLLYLRLLRKAGGGQQQAAERARQYLQEGYQKLLSYQRTDGSFPYWTHGEGDPSLTAYASAFLRDVRGEIEVDERVAEAAQKWLLGQAALPPATEGLALQVLAEAGPAYEGRVVARLGELARRAVQYEDPYAMAAFALASMQARQWELARPAVHRLQDLAQQEQGTSFWALRANTPFHGWGKAGRLETTGLVVKALARWRAHAGGTPEMTSLIEGGALFLLRNKDAAGAWLSTQATVRVLQALWEASPEGGAARPATLELLANGKPVTTVKAQPGSSPFAPIRVDISPWLQAGRVNRFALQTSEHTSPLQAQLAAQWYEPWGGPKRTRELTLQTHYSQTRGAAHEAVRCDVTVSRPEFRGYGMMIAEIGLPPGSDVDREQLADLVAQRQSGLDAFEIGPDRVTLYLWPAAPEAKLTFTFRPRWAMQAVTAPSVAYDYYNPDARAVVPPTRFEVTAGPE